jgi:hypothetical protein
MDGVKKTYLGGCRTSEIGDKDENLQRHWHCVMITETYAFFLCFEALKPSAKMLS